MKMSTNSSSRRSDSQAELWNFLICLNREKSALRCSAQRLRFVIGVVLILGMTSCSASIPSNAKGALDNFMRQRGISEYGLVSAEQTPNPGASFTGAGSSSDWTEGYCVVVDRGDRLVIMRTRNGIDWAITPVTANDFARVGCRNPPR